MEGLKEAGKERLIDWLIDICVSNVFHLGVLSQSVERAKYCLHPEPRSWFMIWFFNKTNKGSLKKWLILGLRQEIYEMTGSSYSVRNTASARRLRSTTSLMSYWQFVPFIWPDENGTKQTHSTVLPKTVKVIKTKKRLWSCHSPKEPKDSGWLTVIWYTELEHSSIF